MTTLSQDKLNQSIVEIKSKWRLTHTVSALSREGASQPLTYTYEKIIGRGSFGVVVKIVDKDKRPYALKKAFQDSRYYNRELDLLLLISHPHIAGMRQYFYNDECASGRFINIIMDYHPLNLEGQIQERVYFSDDRIKKYFYQLLKALEYLHDKKICHRDIKPSNILLDANDNIQLCDFGSAKILDNDDQNISYICSRYYRAPENLMGRTDYDFKIDVWAVGCVIAELRTYSPLFKADSGAGTLREIRQILKVSESDYLELGIKRRVNGNAPGIREYLKDKIGDSDVLEGIERSVVFAPSKRFTAKDILKSKIFRGM